MATNSLNILNNGGSTNPIVPVRKASPIVQVPAKLGAFDLLKSKVTNADSARLQSANLLPGRMGSSQAPEWVTA